MPAGQSRDPPCRQDRAETHRVDRTEPRPTVSTGQSRDPPCQQDRAETHRVNRTEPGPTVSAGQQAELVALLVVLQTDGTGLLICRSAAAAAAAGRCCRVAPGGDLSQRPLR